MQHYIRLYADDVVVYTGERILVNKFSLTLGFKINCLKSALLPLVVCFCVLFTMSSGGKMTSCVESKGAKSAALNKDVDSCTKTQSLQSESWF